MRKFTLIILLYLTLQCKGKFIEGEINTNDNWVFLARFCFLSEQGEFEYHIEFREDQGVPNLLLYYDTDDQWPAVYKSKKTCEEKEAVLHPEQNQIINLTARSNYWKDFSGCVFLPNLPTTSSPKYTLNIPKFTIKNEITTKKPIKTTSIPFQISTTPPSLITTLVDENFTLTDNDTFFPILSDEIIDVYDNLSDFEMVTTMKAPIKKRALQPSTPRKIYQSNRMIVCQNARRFRSSRERWWFIAVSNCNGTKGIHLKYKLLMTNGPPGDYWHEHFSADEFYVLPVLMAFSIAYSFLLLAIAICSMELKSRQLLHTTYKIFIVSILSQFMGILVSSVGFLKYAVNGVPTLRARRIGGIFMGISETSFLLMLLLLAKGFTITRGRLPLSSSIKLTVFMCLYVVTYISIFIYESQVFDPGEVLYLYESPAGYGLMALRICAWCMFIYSTVFTLKHYPEKSNFYYPFNVCGTIWFVAGPAFILSANTYIDKWVRESVVCGILQLITFGGHLSFLILTMPSVANKNFPYHVRTTQIGIMENNTIEQFNHHPYEPSSSATTVIVPLTRRTEEIFEGMYTPTAVPYRNNNNINNDIINRDIMENVTMENVLKWSIAKNLPILEGASSTIYSSAPQQSRSSSSPTLSERSRRDSDIRSTTMGFQDYIREVPVELFTISRMVVQNKETSH